MLLKDIKGIIFDCDGVLVDSEAISCYALNIVFKNQFGIEIGNDYSEVLGTSVKFALKYYLDQNKISKYDIIDLAMKKEEAFFNLASEKLVSFENCENFIKLLLDKSIKISVASSGSHEKIEFSLNKTNLLQYFDYRYSSSDVKKGKPAPDLFLYAAEKLDVHPSNCLVIEDSINGVIAGVNAGMQVIAFPGSFSKDQLVKAGGHYVSNGYAEIMELVARFF